MKEKDVTSEILAYIRTTLNSHNNNVDDFFEGIKEVKNYLKNHVEKKGLTKYVNETISDIHTEMPERLLCQDLYDEVNKTDLPSEGKVELSGEVF